MRYSELTPSIHYKFEDGKLLRQSINGWHDDNLRCTRNIGRFKIYACRFDCALPYTKYYVVDIETGKVLQGEAQHYYSGDNHLSELVSDLQTIQEAK